MFRTPPIVFILCCTLLFCSCTGLQKGVVLAVEKEQADLSCAYFYFLWGTHAEFDENYQEALDAYEKALICDQQAGYIKEKIPVLLLKMGEFDTATEWLANAIDEYPDNNTYRLLLANLYIQQEKVEEAISLYNVVLKTDPDNEGVNLRLALLYTHLEQYEVSENIFKSLLEKDPESYFTHLSYARLLKKMARIEDAVLEYEKSLKLNWSNELAYEIGFLYVSQKMLNDALRIYTQISDHDKFDERAALSRIQALVDLERTKEALDGLYQTRQISKNPANIDLIISKLLLRQNEEEEAKELLDTLTESPVGDEARYMLALLAYQKDDYQTSLAHLAHITSTSEKLEEAVYLQTRIHQKLGNIDQAISLLKKHTTAEESRSPLFYALLSSLYQAKELNDTAMSLMETAVEIYPDNHQLLFEYGLVLEKNGLSDQALMVMQKVIELQPSHAEALNYVGYTWVDRNQHLNKALEYILRALNLKPNNGFIIDSLGWAYYRLGDFQQAAEELERSLELIPDDPHIYDHLGDVYIALDRDADAIKAYHKAYELYSDDEDKNNIKRKLDALENR